MAGGKEGHGVVHIPWYATGFRGDGLEEALLRIAPISLRYGATSWRILRYRDDRYKFLMEVAFQEKLDWDRYWDGDEFIDWRVQHSSWYQVPILPTWVDLSGTGSLPVAEPVTEPGPSYDPTIGATQG
jgi:hypothetical protein